MPDQMAFRCPWLVLETELLAVQLLEMPFAGTGVQRGASRVDTLEQPRSCRQCCPLRHVGTTVEVMDLQLVPVVHVCGENDAIFEFVEQPPQPADSPRSRAADGVDGAADDRYCCYPQQHSLEHRDNLQRGEGKH